MTTHVTFRHPAPFMLCPNSGGVLSTDGADWFAEILRQIAGAAVLPPFIQEDWGVAYLLNRGNERFWVGLSIWPNDRGAWLAHLHMRGFPLFRLIAPGSNVGLSALIRDLNNSLRADPKIDSIRWHEQKELRRLKAVGANEPTYV